jgi:hypothetical protein
VSRWDTDIAFWDFGGLCAAKISIFGYEAILFVFAEIPRFSCALLSAGVPPFFANLKLAQDIDTLPKPSFFCFDSDAPLALAYLYRISTIITAKASFGLALPLHRSLCCAFGHARSLF